MARRFKLKFPKINVKRLWKKLPTWAQRALIWTPILLGSAFLLMIGYYAITLPSIEKPKELGRRPSMTILAQDGSVLVRLGQSQGQFYTLKELPKYVPQAVMAIEDRRFYHHFGIDPIGILRAGFENLIHRDVVQGGSTITQQLAKNMFLSPEQNMKRKIQEAMLAIELEMKYSKDEILAAYLNRVYMGAGAYGIDAAAHRYFNKSAPELSLREAATIAGLLRAPNYFSPLVSPSRAADRANAVLNAMVEADFITEKQAHAAETTPPPPGHRPGAGDAVFYAADYVAAEVTRLIGETRQDLTIQTTLDSSTQHAAEEAIADIQAEAEARHATEAALVAIAPDGGVRALVGGVNYHDSSFNRAFQALRQPGSSFKPMVYLSGLQAGLTPSTVMNDAPITVGDWSPANYDDKYYGQVPLSVALAHSLNSVAVQVLETAGVGRAIENAKNFGITSPMEPNLSLALGTSVLHPIELATAYNTIAQLGEYHDTHVVLSVTDAAGDSLYKYVAFEGKQVARKEDVAALTEMMTGVIKFGTGTGANIGRPQAGKTGTTQDYRDAWFAGFVPQLTAVVWMGNDDNSKMQKVTGGTLPAKTWADFMKRALANDPAMPLAADDVSYDNAPKATGFLNDVIHWNGSSSPTDAAANAGAANVSTPAPDASPEQAASPSPPKKPKSLLEQIFSSNAPSEPAQTPNAAPQPTNIALRPKADIGLPASPASMTAPAPPVPDHVLHDPAVKDPADFNQIIQQNAVHQN